MKYSDELGSLMTEHYSDPLGLLRALGGYYECPKDATGKRLGPLVGYAGRDEEGKQYVGDIYANFARAEEYPQVLNYFAERLCDRRKSLVHVNATVYCGAPMGGIALAQLLALKDKRRFLYPEKKITVAATATSREQSQVVFSRHEIEPGDRVVIVEDVLNNFSTTGQLIDLVIDSGGAVIAIVGLLNRSLNVEDVFSWQAESYPVVSLVRKPIAQYRQGDAEVAADIATRNVVLKPKNEWAKLEAAMATAKQ